MVAYVDFVQSLIYGSAVTPNHQSWLASTSGTGTDWLTHHLDRLLPAYEAWLASEKLPPVTPWNGVRCEPWDPTTDVALDPDLDGSFTGITTLEALGTALRNRLALVSGVARELLGQLKAPFSYRFWSYAKWAWQMRERFLGRRVFPVGNVLDRDGTPLSATPFCDAFDDLHRNWHNGSTPSTVATPGFYTTAGQRARRGILGGSRVGEEFLRFHRDHMELIHRWLARTGQPPLLPIDMGRTGGWPPTSASIWTPPSPWAEDEVATTATSALAGLASTNDVGAIESSYHGVGHGQNTDIGPLAHNNYVPRFHNWHGWIDAQWWWREPRFVQSVPTTGARTRFFRFVRQDGLDFPGLQALSIVRDPLLTADSVYPDNAVGGVDLSTGAGSLKMRLYVRDPFGRTLRMSLTAEVFDGSGSLVAALTATVRKTIGPAGDHPLDTEFLEDIPLPGAFRSDDPGRANDAAGFVNSRVKVTGRLWVPSNSAPDDPTQSPDPGFVHEDIAILDLVREKQAPQAVIYQDLSSFSEDQVNAVMSGTQAVFSNAFYLVAQDRTTPAFPTPAWPTLLADEVKGLVVGLQAASGMFDDSAHPPEVVIWQDAVDAPIAGLSVQLVSGPAKEDPSLPAELPQRFTYRYAIVFAAGGDAFTGLAAGDQRFARIVANVRDRAGNRAQVVARIKLFKDANPYMIDGPVSWLSVDTRVFTASPGDTRLGETLAAGQPITFLQNVLGRLNAGTTGTETFDSLAQDGPAATLEYATEIPNPSTGGSTPIYNFALAKIRLRAPAGANQVRAFFRLFRYAAPSLLFSTTAGYRARTDGAIPHLGFESETAGAALTSIPFFATPRVNVLTASMDTQTDGPNVFNFLAGGTDERVHYFGVWLDINDPNARVVASYSATQPDGPFTAAALQSLRTLMRDFHQCMVVEIRYAGDPTEPLASPASSDNLAQRNLAILQSDNPGDAFSRTVEHAFEIDLTRPPREVREQISDLAVMVRGVSKAAAIEGDETGMDEAAHAGHEHGEHEHGGHTHEGGAGEATCAVCGDGELDSDFCCACCGGLGENGPLRPESARGMLSTFAFERRVHDEAMSIAMTRPEGGAMMMKGDHEGIVELFGAEAAANVRKPFPFVFHPTRWLETLSVVDELMIRWNELPRGTRVRLFLPGQNAEEIVSLRNLRHAPRTVRAEGGSVLGLDVTDVTYVPVLPVVGDRQAAMMTFELPAGVKAGQRFVVDVTHLRAGSTVQNGGLRFELVVSKAEAIFESVARGVVLAHERWAQTPALDRWRPIAERRLDTERRRARSLANRLGIPWQDPTTWTDGGGTPHPVKGTKIRVVLERILVLDDKDPLWKGAGEVDFSAVVRTEDNGGVEQRTRFPPHGHYKISSGQVVHIEHSIFEGFVEKHLVIRIRGMERDVLDPDDHLGSYVRTFCCPVSEWLGSYRPGDERVDPEEIGAWHVWLRIERV